MEFAECRKSSIMNANLTQILYLQCNLQLLIRSWICIAILAMLCIHTHILDVWLWVPVHSHRTYECVCVCVACVVCALRLAVVFRGSQIICELQRKFTFHSNRNYCWFSANACVWWCVATCGGIRPIACLWMRLHMLCKDQNPEHFCRHHNYEYQHVIPIAGACIRNEYLAACRPNQMQHSKIPRCLQ